MPIILNLKFNAIIHLKFPSYDHKFLLTLLLDKV